MQRSQSVKCTTNGKIQTHVLADFRQTLTRSTTPSEQQSRQTLTEFDDVYTSAVSPSPSSLIGLVWLSNWQNTANSRLPYCWWWCLLSLSGSLLSFSPQPLSHGPLQSSLGANDSVVTGHAWTHSVPRSSRRDTGGNDGFTAWQIMIRSLDRRLRLLAVLWRYSGQIALMLVASTRTPWVKYTLAREKNSDWLKSGPVKTGPTWPSATPLSDVVYGLICG